MNGCFVFCMGPDGTVRVSGRTCVQKQGAGGSGQ